LPDAALLESRAPIVVFAPPLDASESERRGYFLDGTIRSTAQSTNATLPGVHQHREISGDVDNRIIKRRRIDADRRDDQLSARDIHHLPLPELCPVHSTQSIIIPLQLSLGYPLIVPSFYSPEAA
jgi:hypothetical protein